MHFVSQFVSTMCTYKGGYRSFNDLKATVCYCKPTGGNSETQSNQRAVGENQNNELKEAKMLR